MKKLIYILLLNPLYIISQAQPSKIIEICSGISYLDNGISENTYFKDINNTLDKFTGTWKYERGNDIVIFKIVKVTQKYDAEHKVFKDYIIGNYSYSNDGGNTYVVNSIATSTISEEVENNTMYTPCQDSDTKMTYSFKELIFNKKGRSCAAIFEFLPGSLTQMTVKITNRFCNTGTFAGEEPFNGDFSIPTNMMVIKQ